MKIHEFSIKHPVTILMCVLSVLVLGIISLMKLSIAFMPDIDIPMAVVMTEYEGVGSEEIESMITKKIEDAIGTVNNIKSIRSQSSEGYSMVRAEFNYGTDLDFAALKMREKVDLIRDSLPDGADAPTVMQLDPNSMAVVRLGIFSKDGTMDEVALKELVEDKIEPRLERLDGVASISISGGKTREIKVDVDPQQAARYGVTLDAIIAKLQAENLNEPGGTVEYAQKNLLVRTMGKFGSLQQIEKMPLTLPSGGTILLRDVAVVSDGFEKITTYARMNRENSIGVSVIKQSGGNTVKVVNLVKRELQKIQQDYPNLNARIIFDQAEFIEDSIRSVAENAISGGVLAVAILVLFLGNIRTALFIATSIPISIISTFVLMYFTGITLNTISLAGLALGVGMMVDNSIVVLENIFRYRQEGHSMLEAARLGTGEVFGAVLASTLTTVVVFLPIVFIEGMTAQIFKELALTVTFSLMASLVVSYTLIPLLSSRYLKIANEGQPYQSEQGFKRIIRGWTNGLEKVLAIYHSLLRWVLEHRKFTLFVTIGVFAFSLCLIPRIGIEFYPAADQGQFTVDIELPQGSFLEDTDTITRRVEEIIFEIPELEKVFVQVGSSGSMGPSSSSETQAASLSVTLKPVTKRDRKTATIVDEVRQKVAAIAGAKIEVSEVTQSMGRSGGSPVEVQIYGDDFEVLKELSMKVKESIVTVEGIREAESSIEDGRPEAQIVVNRDKAAEYGLGSSEVAALLTTAILGEKATTYEIAGEEYNIRVQYPEASRKSYEQLQNIYVITDSGVQVPLLDIAEIKQEEGPVEIIRKNQERYATISAQIFGRDIGSINRDIQARLKEISLPDGYSIGYGGDAENINESFSALTQALILSIFLVYMTMACQFESLLQPFIIMFSVPVAYSGSLFALALTGRSLGMTAFIGVIMLAGIVVNNAIVLIDYANTLKTRGMGTHSAILKAGPTRLKPILMTTLTTILGLVPLALGIGEGAESQAPMATVVIGGLLTSTVLTLVIVPVVYTLFDDWHDERIRRKMKRSGVREEMA